MVANRKYRTRLIRWPDVLDVANRLAGMVFVLYIGVIIGFWVAYHITH